MEVQKLGPSNFGRPKAFLGLTFLLVINFWGSAFFGDSKYWMANNFEGPNFLRGQNIEGRVNIFGAQSFWGKSSLVLKFFEG